MPDNKVFYTAASPEGVLGFSASLLELLSGAPWCMTQSSEAPFTITIDAPTMRHPGIRDVVQRFIPAAIAVNIIDSNDPYVNTVDVRDKFPSEEETPIRIVCLEVLNEVKRSKVLYPEEFRSPHEGLGIIAEEFTELQEHIFTNHKRRDVAAMRKEAIQLAAMAVKFAVDICDGGRNHKS
jgi:hypothetical protein